MISRVPPNLVGPIAIWRLDQLRHASTWDSGQGAFLLGGRWNSKGVRAVYCCLDPATAILEVAVHKGFRALDTVPHVLTRAEITDPSQIHVVNPSAVPNQNWLLPGLLARAKSSLNGGVIVLKGSTAKRSVESSLSEGDREFRERLIRQGKLRQSSNEFLEFTEDVEFESSSSAASVVNTCSRNGPESWVLPGSDLTFGQWMKNGRNQ